MDNMRQIIIVKGKKREVRSIPYGDTTIIFTGSLLHIAQIQDEDWLEDNFVADPEKIIKLLKSVESKPDLFTFIERFPVEKPKYPYFFDWDNFAVVPITTYEHWWTKQINDKTRNCARKAGKTGVDIRMSPFDDELVMGIHRIYNETPLRQGKPFWHYGKDVEAVKLENATYTERSDFICAYLENEMIGFIKLVYCGNYARIMQIISKIEYRNKNLMNALVAKAVELCAEKKVPNLVYGKFMYGKREEDNLLNFKKHNGFKRVDYPRYFIPISKKGFLALKLGLHDGWKRYVPSSFSAFTLSILKNYYAWKYGTGSQKEAMAG